MKKNGAELDREEYNERLAALRGNRAPEPAPERSVLRTLEKDVRVKMTPEEHRLRGVAFAEASAKLNALKLLHKEQRAEMAAVEKREQAVLDALGHDVATGEETRTVECVEFAHWSRKLVELVRPDTGEVVTTRGITPEDRQMVFK